MTKFRFLGAAAILSALFAAPAFAERMIDEPGSYAFFYPNGDLGIGLTRPTADAFAMVPPRGSGVMMKMKMRQLGRARR
jgi:hypothetical protein